MIIATLAELAQRIQGTLLGDPSREISDVASIQTAREHEISFLTDLKMRKELNRCKAGALIVPAGFTTDRCPVIQVPVEAVLPAFENLSCFFRSPQPALLTDGIDASASIDPSASLAENVRIGAGVVVGANVVIEQGVQVFPGVVIMSGTRIGEGSTIFPNVVLYENTRIGKNCILHANSVVGAYGFGYDSSSGEHLLSRQWGNVVLEDNVELGACTTIDRGTYGSTTIGYGTKIDNLVMIAHNCRLGRNNLICSGVGIAGSTTTDDYVVMAGRVGVRDHVHIGKGAIIGAMSGIMADVEDGANVLGVPATPAKEQMRILVSLAQLPKMRQEFRELQRKVEKLLEQSGE